MAKKQTEVRGGVRGGKTAQQLEVLDVEPTGLAVQDEDAQLVATAGTAIREFLKGLAAFFTTAQALERTALATLETARGLKAPTSAAEDEQIQRFIKKTSADKRQVEEHWKITSTISQFHRRMTARRAKASDALEEANKIGNSHHNAYVAAERRRAAEEQERLRRQAEEKARLEREEELLRLEAAAVAREEASADLSDRERLFVDYITGPYPDAQRAAHFAGFKDALKSGSRLMGSKKIQAAIQAKREALAIREQKAARELAPIDYEVEEVRPNITKAAGFVERTTHAADLLDERALVNAILSGEHGIPTDLLRIDTPALNEYARKLHERINLWPGVRYRKTTKGI